MNALKIPVIIPGKLVNGKLIILQGNIVMFSKSILRQKVSSEIMYVCVLFVYINVLSSCTNKKKIYAPIGFKITDLYLIVITPRRFSSVLRVQAFVLISLLQRIPIYH